MKDLKEKIKKNPLNYIKEKYIVKGDYCNNKIKYKNKKDE
jgi:hypothetical protein